MRNSPQNNIPTSSKHPENIFPHIETWSDSLTDKKKTFAFVRDFVENRGMRKFKMQFATYETLFATYETVKKITSGVDC
jgi:hypothetical protein